MVILSRSGIVKNKQDNINISGNLKSDNLLLEIFFEEKERE